MVSCDESTTGRISCGFEHLAKRVHDDPAAVHFEVLIVGSGYGGSIAADVFAGRVDPANGNQKVRVGVLERGREYLPGAFPHGLAELPRYVRMERNKEGLFDIRLGPEVTTLLANGLGGGSLINAGVMEIPKADVFAQGWPVALSTLSSWQDFFKRARRMLGAADAADTPNTIESHPDPVPQKYESIRRISPSPANFRPAALTVAMSDTTSTGQINLNRCIRCGDCATGCNFGAKISHDVNLLVRAHDKGASVFSGATVLNLERETGTGQWIVNCVHTDAKLRARAGGPVRVRANRVVLAAGTLGTTEILMRSQVPDTLEFSDRLGRQCSTNGDALITDYDTNELVRDIADETQAPGDRDIGPTITGIVDLQSTPNRITIEEISVPAGLRRAFTELFGTVNALHSLDEGDRSFHWNGVPSQDIYAVGEDRIERSAVYALMGDDGAAGEIELHDEVSDERDGIARIRWEGLQHVPVFDTQLATLRGLTEDTGGRIMPNPAWQLLPTSMEWLLGGQRGPLVTVHPLGGCAMADSMTDGVVDDKGRVYNPRYDAPTEPETHTGLVVLDGSMIPTALRTNPALTISAVALRAAEALVSDWGFVDAGAALPQAGRYRPVFRDTNTALPEAGETHAQFIERMSGPVVFKDANGVRRAGVAELTLRFQETPLLQLCAPPGDGGDPTLVVDTAAGEPMTRSRLRIFAETDWNDLQLEAVPPRQMERRLEEMARFAAPIAAGELRIFRRRWSFAFWRVLRAGYAYLRNRGLRDIYQAYVDGDDGPGPWSRLVSGIALASRSGEVRVLEYDLRLGSPEPGAEFTLSRNRIEGRKRFTYGRRANPWRQMMEMRLERFPRLRKSGHRTLKLDPVYLARIGVPLFHLTRQRDGAAGLAELISFAGYFVRLVLGLHIWTFRHPDAPTTDRVAYRLPDRPLPGLPASERHDVKIGWRTPAGGDTPHYVTVRLTRYPRVGSSKPPVLMLHGYSASGTTFAHPQVYPNFATHFWNAGYDVWIADLRTSSGMPHAEKAWSFEQVGEEDVPAAVDEVFRETGRQLDVIAHCMGTVVFSMGMLQPGSAMLGKIRRVAFTQVGPLVVLSPANIFRGYVLRYLIDFLPDSYSFSPDNPTLADDLLDRLLYSLPYPEKEFDLENPRLWWKRTPWVRTRHRMDALYGRDFNLVNMGQEVLDYIDDHFGPLSLGTVTQTIHFARHGMITSRAGRNRWVSRANFGSKWEFPSMSVHGRDNGLSDVKTVDRMRQILQDAGRVYLPPKIIEGAGHQDALVGTKRFETLDAILDFFEHNITQQSEPASHEMAAHPPWLGPIVTEQRDLTSAQVLRVGTRPTHRSPELVAMLRVDFDGQRVSRPGGGPWDLPYVLANMLTYTSPQLRNEGWDAFERPTPDAMPDVGNALLVLVLYDESAVLSATVSGHYRASIAAAQAAIRPGPMIAAPGIAQLVQEVWRFDAVSGRRRDSGPPMPIETFERAGRAVLTRLLRQNGPWVPQPGTLPSGPTASPAPAGSTPGTWLPLNAPNAPAPEEAAAALGALVDDDRDLSDGLVTCDPPKEPPTVPDPAGTSFALASCQYPAGLLDKPIAYAAYRDVRHRIEDAAIGIVPKFLVLAGDQVYVDPTAGLYDPSTSDDRYGRPYEFWLQQQPVRAVLRQAPSFMLLDDHEIENDWQPVSSPDDDDNAELCDDGVEAYLKYQRGLPPPSRSFQFRQDGYPFFMLDTRSSRDHRDVTNLSTASLVSPSDLQALLAWLEANKDSGPKFVVTPPILLPRHRRAAQGAGSRLDPGNLAALRSDGWDGYPSTMIRVLGHIAAEQIPHVVFLSGDEHIGCRANVDLQDASGNVLSKIVSLHTGGTHAPFPFVNSLAEDFLADETFGFSAGGKSYRCVVSAQFFASNRHFTYFRVRSSGPGRWSLDYELSGSDQGTIALQ